LIIRWRLSKTHHPKTDRRVEVITHAVPIAARLAGNPAIVLRLLPGDPVITRLGADPMALSGTSQKQETAWMKSATHFGNPSPGRHL
jgi:hypothetical protein